MHVCIRVRVQANLQHVGNPPGATWSKNRPEGTTDPSPGTPPPVSPGVSSGEDLTQMTIPLMAAAAVLALLGVVLGIAYAAGRRTAAAKRAGLL